MVADPGDGTVIDVGSNRSGKACLACDLRDDRWDAAPRRCRSGATGSNTGAEIAVHPSGAFIYASNRGDNTIAVRSVAGDGRLSLVGQAATLGRTPRHFTLDPTGTRLYVANQDSNTIVPFAIDGKSGMPSPIAAPVTVASPSFIGLVELR